MYLEIGYVNTTDQYIKHEKIFSLDTDADIITGNHAENGLRNVGQEGVTMLDLYKWAIDHQASFIRRELALRHPYDEKYRIVLVKEPRRASLLDNIAHVLNATRHSAQCKEGYFQLASDNTCKRSLSNSRRPPKDKAVDMAALQHFPKHSTRSNQVLLPDVIVERQRTHSFC